MELIAIAHPKFRYHLIQEVMKRYIIYSGQALIHRRSGVSPYVFESYKTTNNKLELFMRAVKISNEPLLKDFFYSLSDKSLYRRFISVRINIPHERLQDFVVIDNTKELVILAKIKHVELEEVAGLGQYIIRPGTHSAEVALIVKDDY